MHDNKDLWGSRLLINEPPMQFLPELAVVLGGPNEALILQQIQYWTTINAQRGDDRHFREGSWWCWNTLGNWSEHFRWISESTVRRLLKKLRDMGVLVAKKFEQADGDMTLWYRVDYQKLVELQGDSEADPPSAQNEQMASAQNEQMNITERSKETEIFERTSDAPEGTREGDDEPNAPGEPPDYEEARKNLPDTAGREELDPMQRFDAMQFQVEWRRATGYPWRANPDRLIHVLKYWKAAEIRLALEAMAKKNAGWNYFRACLEGMARRAESSEGYDHNAVTDDDIDDFWANFNGGQ